MRLGFAAVVVLALTSVASGQSTGGRKVAPPPSIVGVFPPGGEIGAVVDWAIAGRGLARVEGVVVGGGGVELLEWVSRAENAAVARVRIEPGAMPGLRELRVDGPDGVSNLAIVRLDTLPQSVEAEPNDDRNAANPIGVDAAVAGVLMPRDLDHFRVEGKPGARLTIDLEARRLGSGIRPVLFVLDARSGMSLAMGRELAGIGADCRLVATLPADGRLVVLVREATYGGGPNARYRLRIATAPFATALFPLGGPAGGAIEVEATGGGVVGSIRTRVELPRDPGTIFLPGPFATPLGPLVAPNRLAVGGRDPATEILERAEGPTPIAIGQTASGRIARRGEVDRFVVEAKKGAGFRVEVEAGTLGSWIDSVVTVRDKAGKVVAENDDREEPAQVTNNRSVTAPSLAAMDSRIDVDPEEDGPLTIAVTDRYGTGGDEFGYRLSIGVDRPDFAVELASALLVDEARPTRGAPRRVATADGTDLGDRLNLLPGSKVTLGLVVIPRGRPGPVTLRVEGLPDDATAEPVKVDLPGPGSKKGPKEAARKSAELRIEVPGYARGSRGELRIVATAEPEPGRRIVREATSTEVVASPVETSVEQRPVARRVDRFPIRVIDDGRPRFVGPPGKPRLREIRSRGVLLQGDRIELGLRFSTSPLGIDGFEIGAGSSPGLASNAVIAARPSGEYAADGSEDGPIVDDGRPDEAIVRLLATKDAAIGAREVSVWYTLGDGVRVERSATVIVRAPIAVEVASAPVTIRPGGTASVRIGLRREPGAEVPVEVRVEGLPPGVEVVGGPTVAPGSGKGADAVEIRLKASEGANSNPGGSPFRVVAVARMPRGPVEVVPGERPMIAVDRADD